MSYYIYFSREKRVKTLLARIKRVKKIARAMLDTPEWQELGVPKEWIRALNIQRKLETKLGTLAGYSLIWRDDK